MKILVTGGAGFIGSHLVEKLIKNNKVIVIDNYSTGRYENIKHLSKNKNLTVYKKDIYSDKIDYLFKDVNTVFHIAALADIVPSIQNPTNYFNSNVTGTLNVLKSCTKYKVKKIVYTASSSCYGIPKNFPTSENEKIEPQYPYALTKKIGEDLIMHWAKLYNINATSLRLFNVYGTRSRTSGTYGAMFGVFLKQKLSKRPFTVVGDGKQKRDFTYVTDVVEALIKAAKYKKNFQIFNIGSGTCVSILKICNLLKNPYEFIPKRPGEPDITFANIKKLGNF